ncbi:Zinc finger protein 542 [Plakobranchus ocellatus]|uniref:Zinc finger protein 542 n=1 Tax=Plakobranchus ocellatus TaxID=259542 RepID=A0AAV3ZZL4_9GAST|nr:Zinc finger protein 542 [Plakobranchus ocellatus]
MAALSASTSYGSFGGHSLSNHQHCLQNGKRLCGDMTNILPVCSVSPADSAEQLSNEASQSEIFSCLFCDHVSQDEVSISLHLAEVHKCMSKFSCTDCDFQCGVREQFSLHVNLNHCHPPQQETEAQEGNGIDTQEAASDYEDEHDMTLSDAEDNLHNKRENSSMGDLPSSPTLTEVDPGKNEEMKELDDSEEGSELERERHKERQNEVRSKYPTFKLLEKALAEDANIILDVPRTSFPDHDRFPCSQCKYVAKKFEYFKEHFMRHAGLSPHTCEQCSATFVSNREMHRHRRRIHASKSILKCSQCSYTSLFADSLRKHVLYRHATEKDYKHQCPDCPQKFAVREKLHYHRLSKHSIKSKYSCELCDFSTNYSRTYRVHMNRHTGLVYLCPECGNSYHSQDQLQQHQKSHKETFYCDSCPYTCTRPQSLQNHVRIHTNEMPFQCPFCSFQTRTSSQLSQHKLKHKEESM